VPPGCEPATVGTFSCDQLRESGLADTRLARNNNNAALAREGIRQRILQLLQFDFSANEDPGPVDCHAGMISDRPLCEKR
jgi:hypothetical protein